VAPQLSTLTLITTRSASAQVHKAITPDNRR
jgi:hypothetical protein